MVWVMLHGKLLVRYSSCQAPEAKGERQDLQKPVDSRHELVASGVDFLMVGGSKTFYVHRLCVDRDPGAALLPAHGDGRTAFAPDLVPIVALLVVLERLLPGVWHLGLVAHGGAILWIDDELELVNVVVRAGVVWPIAVGPDRVRKPIRVIVVARPILELHLAWEYLARLDKGLQIG